MVILGSGRFLMSEVPLYHNVLCGDRLAEASEPRARHGRTLDCRLIFFVFFFITLE